MRTFFLIASLAILAFRAAAASVPEAGAAPDSAVVSELRQLEKTFGGHLGVMARDLKTGRVVRYNDTERFPTASLIKLPVMGAWFDMIDRGRLRASQRITLTASDKVGGSGILSSLSDSTSITLLDAVRLMTVLSDNTATNLVLDRLGSSHEERLALVNEFLLAHGLKDTRLLNRLMSVATKKDSPEAVRYSIGVSTPADMVSFLEQLYRKTLVSPSSCEAMVSILKSQFYEDGIPRLLPAWDCSRLEVAHKTGFVNETRTDAGIVYSDRGDFAIAIFVDKHPDHSSGIDNLGAQLIARAARAVWNHFTGMTGFGAGAVHADDVDWNTIPGGKWGIFRSQYSPFPHPDRAAGLTRRDGTHYPAFPHYSDSSVVVFVPKHFRELPDGSNLIVHFHGHNNDNLGALEQSRFPQAMVAQQTNALLVMVQGPYRARDSFSGKMESDGGLKHLVDDLLRVMQKEGVVTSAGIHGLVISAHSGGYRPAAFALEKGGLRGNVDAIFLFDALYDNADYFRNWLLSGKGQLYGAYTEHLEEEYSKFLMSVTSIAADRVHFARSTVEHDDVPRAYISEWLSQLGPDWNVVQ